MARKMSSNLTGSQLNLLTRVYLGGGVREAWAKPEAQYFAKAVLSDAAYKSGYAKCLQEAFNNVITKGGGKDALSKAYKACEEKATLALDYANIWGTKGGKKAKEQRDLIQKLQEQLQKQLQQQSAGGGTS